MQMGPSEKHFGGVHSAPEKAQFFASVISSYTAYMVSKTQISPQQKHESSVIFNCRFIMYSVTTKKKFRKIRAYMRAQESKMCACAFQI